MFIARRVRKRKREADERRRAAEEAEAKKRRAALEVEADKVRARCDEEDAKHECRFWFVRRESLLNFVAQGDEKSLPSFQELQRRGFPVEKTITRDGAFRAKHASRYLAVSHRWYSPSKPDEDGLQLRQIKEHLEKKTEIQFQVRLLYAADERSDERQLEDADAKFTFLYMLHKINCLPRLLSARAGGPLIYEPLLDAI